MQCQLQKVIFKEASVGDDDEISVDDPYAVPANDNPNATSISHDNENTNDYNGEKPTPTPTPTPTRRTPKRQKSNLVVLLKSKTKTSSDGSINNSNNSRNQTKEQAEENNKNAQQSSSTDDNNNDSSNSPPIEPCAICLADYEDGDEICWSHNDKCPHMFHRSCIQEWLLTHEECPCCRQDFLCLWGDEDYEGRTMLMHNPNNNVPPALDWATDLAAVIRQQILHGNQQLAVLTHNTTNTSNDGDRNAANDEEDGAEQYERNAVISVTDLHLAAGLLLYRHFPWLLQGDFDEQDDVGGAAAAAGGGGNDNNGASRGQVEMRRRSFLRRNIVQDEEQPAVPALVVDMNNSQETQQQQGNVAGQPRSQPRRQRLRSYVMSNRERLVRQARAEADLEDRRNDENGNYYNA